MATPTVPPTSNDPGNDRVSDTESKDSFSSYLKSPHFLVISTGAIVLILGLGMYARLSDKMDEQYEKLTKIPDGQLNYMSEKIQKKIDKLDASIQQGHKDLENKITEVRTSQSRSEGTLDTLIKQNRSN